MPQRPPPNILAVDVSAHRAIIARCEAVLIESCNTELRLAHKFCDLAELQLARHHLEHAQCLIVNGEKAVAVAGKYSKDPTQRRAELSGLSDRIAHLSQQIRDQS